MMFVRLSLSATGDGLSKEWSGQEKTLLDYVPRATAAAGGNLRERGGRCINTVYGCPLRFIRTRTSARLPPPSVFSTTVNVQANGSFKVSYFSI